MTGRLALAAALSWAIACAPPPEERRASAAPPERPDLLLVTLDTTRADRVAPEGPAAATPHLAALAARGVRFTNAYSTVPTTLPAHVSMMSGLYPAGHGVHENGRRLGDGAPLVAERLRELGYATAAFVSGYPLEGRFGLDRGFEVYDDEFGAGRNERIASATTDRALAWLASRPAGRPIFLWVHYYDPHEPYAPPEPFRSRFAGDPYLGEIAFVDAELGRLTERFETGAHKGGRGLLVVGDHGEGLGDHGEALHGNLLYQGVMRVPLVLAGSVVSPSIRADEDLTYQAIRAARGFERLEEVALGVVRDDDFAADNPALIQRVLDAPTDYSEACLSFCDLAPRCHAQRLASDDPIILGDEVARFLGKTTVSRALELMAGGEPADEREADLQRQLVS